MCVLVCVYIYEKTVKEASSIIFNIIVVVVFVVNRRHRHNKSY